MSKNKTILLQTMLRSWPEKHLVCAPLLPCYPVSMRCPRLQSQGAIWGDWLKQSWEIRILYFKSFENTCQALLSTAASKEGTSDVFYHENLYLSIHWPHSLPPIFASGYLSTPSHSHGWQGKGEPAVKSKSPVACQELAADVLVLPLHRQIQEPFLQMVSAPCPKSAHLLIKTCALWKALVSQLGAGAASNPGKRPAAQHSTDPRTLDTC